MKVGTIEKVSTSVSELTIIKGKEVLDKLSDAEFITGWDTLYLSCPWATVFQSREFLTTWYQTYQHRFLPVLVYARQHGRLTGLLPLTLNKNILVGGGHFDAEYQTWLALPENHDWFIKSVFLELRKKYAGLNIELKYISKETPIEWARSDEHWKNRCVVGERPRPLMQIDDESFTRELRKKNRREKINRLKRLGNFSYQRITDRATFSSIFDELAIQYDFRQAAKFNKTNFKHNPLKKQLLLGLFDQDLLHVSLLKINDEIIAANVAVAGRAWIYLKGMNSFAPMYAKYSPGILHFLILGQQLSAEEVEVFDLTPGDDPYKDHLANKHDHVYELFIANSERQNLKWYYLKNILRKHTYSFLIRKGIKPVLLTQLFKRKYYHYKERLRIGWVQGFVNLFKYERGSQSCWVYEPKQGLPGSEPALEVKKNNLSDLLDFNGKGAMLTRWEFLEDAMRRLEAGQHSYTLSKYGMLIGCLWVGGLNSNLPNRKTSQVQLLPDGATVLHGLYWHFEGSEKLVAFISTVAQQASSEKEGEVVLMVNNRHKRIYQTLKSTGFKEL